MKHSHRRLIIQEKIVCGAVVQRLTCDTTRLLNVSAGCIRQGDQQYRVAEPMSQIRVSSQWIVFLEKQIERGGRAGGVTRDAFCDGVT
jgi:hypothetical protein